MKYKLSVTLEETLVCEIIGTLSTQVLRNKSRLIEYAVKKFLEGQNGFSIKT